MATYRAISNGDWSNLAIWQDNGTGTYVASTVLPSALDDVYSNNYVVTLDVDIHVYSLNGTAITNITAGGRFVVNTNRNIICDFRITSHGTAFSNAGTVSIETNSNLTVNITANEIVTLNTNGVACVNIGSSGHTVTINAILKGSTGAADNFTIRAGANNSTVTVNGNIIGAHTTSSTFRGLGSGNTYNFNGIIFGGSSSTGTALNMDANNTVFINGIVQTANSANTITNINSTTYFDGVVNATDAKTLMGGNGTMFFTGEINLTANARFPIGNLLRIVPDTSTYLRFYQNDVTFNDYALLSSVPLEQDVRQGVVYTSAKIGTLVVPNPSNVRKDVATDDTVGTADLTAEDFFDAIANSSNPVAERLRNVATVETTGDQIAALT
jgi:hypothetical protein